MSRVLVLQIEDRVGLMPQDMFLLYNAETARLHGFAYERRDRGPDGCPPWWAKVFVTRDLLRERQADVDLLLWLDSDAFLRRPAPAPAPATDKPVHPLVALAAADPERCLWASGDARPLYRSPFNAGVYLVRNDERGRRLFDRWCALFRPERWRRDGDGRWACDAPPGADARHAGACRWAGVHYEQGAFVQHLLPHAATLGVRLLPYHVFNENTLWDPHPDSLAVHLCDGYRGFRGQVIVNVWRSPAALWCALLLLLALPLLVWAHARRRSGPE